jgi:hypothetical protein
MSVGILFPERCRDHGPLFTVACPKYDYKGLFRAETLQDQLSKILR